jgi:hypothetical protein
LDSTQFSDQLNYIISKFEELSMASGSSSEKVSIEEAVKRLVDVDTTNANRINKLEAQIDEMLKSFNDYREQNTNSTKIELQAMSEKMSEKIESIQSMTVSFYEEATSKYEDSKQQLNRMYNDMNINMGRIFNKLNQMSASTVITPISMQNKEVKVEEQATEQNRTEGLPTMTTDSTLGHTLPATNQTTTPISGHTFQTTPYLMEPEMKYVATVPPGHPLNGIKHSIIVPPSSAAPAFYGKPTESPTQFLIRVQEYAESVHSWDRVTLVNGISQFLRDSALEWYCQLRMSHRRPQTWTEFTDLFLAQFNSPIRKARQEQEWHECKQKENETINEFLVRLRALWREQKPKETETDLVKHLFCRMRNDLLNMIGISRNASLDEVIIEVQQIEDILYRRAKGERLTKQIKQASSSNAETSPNKRYNEDYTRRTTPWSNKENSSNSYTRKTKDYQVNEVTPSRYTYSRNQITVEPNMTQQPESYGCYTCEGYGPFIRYCPTQHGDYHKKKRFRDEYAKQISSEDDTVYYSTHHNDDDAYQRKPPENMNMEDSPNIKMVLTQGTNYETRIRWGLNEPSQNSDYNAQITADKTLSEQQLGITKASEEEYGSNPFWPEGTESWHIHEIKPQRKVFKQSICSDPVETTKHSIIESQSKTLKKRSDSHTNSLLDETVCQFDETNDLQSQHMVEPSMEQFKPPNKSRQNTTKSTQNVSIVRVVNEQQQRYRQTPEMTYLQLKVKLQRKSDERSRKPIQNDLSTVSKSFEQSSLHYQPHNRLLPLIVTCLIQLLLFIFSVLLRTGRVHNLTKLSGILYDQSSTHDSESISDKLTTCSKKFLKKSQPYGKTIKILRDLESLLIYAITL